MALAQTAIAPSKAAAPNKDALGKQVVQRGHDAYYSLRTLGLVEFQSTIKPNWAQVLKDQSASDPAQAQAALNLLNGPWWLLVKVTFFAFVFVWLRATLPRLRYDQLMRLSWGLLLPLGLLNVLVTAVLVVFFSGGTR